MVGFVCGGIAVQIAWSVEVKLLFLDIDGVFNSYRWMTSERYSQERDTLTHDQYMLDPEVVQVLDSLLDQVPDLKIVLSSTWRLHCDCPKMDSLLQERGLRNTGCFVGRTSSWGHHYSQFLDLESSQATRGTEILEWLYWAYVRQDGSCDTETHFVILDDDSDMYCLKEHFIKTSQKTGLVAEQIPAILAVLEKTVPAAQIAEWSQPLQKEFDHSFTLKA